MSESSVGDPADNAPPEPVRGGARLPDWREHLEPLDRDDEPAEEPEAADLDDPEDDEPGSAYDFDDEGDENDWDVDEPARRRWRDVFRRGDNNDRERRWSGERIAHTSRERLRKAAKSSPGRPAYHDRPVLRQTPLAWWRGISATTRWGLYNGCALGIGWYFGIPQFVRDEVAYLAGTYGSWSAPGVGIWYVAPLMAWMLSHSSRHWWPPAALLARVPWISIVVGVLLYGSTDLPN